MKPVIVFTVFRRYHELDRNLKRLRELSGEFREKPDVVVVWAQPEVCRLWFFKELSKEGFITHLLTRLKLPGEELSSTTYPESVNIRTGLDFVREKYLDGYAIVQSGDITPKENTAYRFIDDHMHASERAVLFYWPNGMVPTHIWHTNFFAVCLNETYWPPVSKPDDNDVLEWQWGKLLLDRRLPGIVENHNYNAKRFDHTHQSETLPAWPIKPQSDTSGVFLSMSGYQPWYVRLWTWLRGVLPK